MKEQFYIYTLPDDNARKIEIFIKQLDSLGIKCVSVTKEKNVLAFSITYDKKELQDKITRNAGRPAQRFSIEAVLNYQKDKRLYPYPDKIAEKLGVNTSTYYRHLRKLKEKYGSLENAVANGVEYF